MNITISHDGAAIVLRIEPEIRDAPIQIDGLIPQGTGPSPVRADRSPGRSWLQSRPVRLLGLGVILVAFIQIGMVMSAVSRTAVAPKVATASAPPSQGVASSKGRPIPPEVAIADALAGKPRLIGSAAPPSVKPGSAKAQTRFGLNP